MAFDPKEVKKVAHLAQLAIDEAMIPKYAGELSNIFDLVAQMNQQDTQNIEPMAHPLSVTQRLREDQVTEPNQRELFQSIAPLVKAGLYLVPQVIE